MPNPVQHFEFWSDDPERLSKFYEQALAWKVQAHPQIDYHVVDTDSGGAGIGGGILKPQAGPWPAKLTFYITVPDLAQARSNVTEAGGKILVEHQPVPGVGEFALFEDPDGRVMGLWREADRG